MESVSRKPPNEGDLVAVFSRMFGHADNFTGLLDVHGTLLELNRPALDLISLSRDEAVGRPFWQLSAWPPAAQPAIEHAVVRAAHGDKVRFEADVTCANARCTVLDVSVRPVLGTHGDAAFLIAEGRDRTPERETRRRYQAVFDALGEGVVQQERGGGLSACNGAAERILGLSYAQLSGLSPIDPRWHTVHEDGSPYPADTHPAMVALGTGAAQRDRIMGVAKPDGSLTWIKVSAQPLFRPDERLPYAVVSSFVDVTALKEAASTLEHLALHDPLTGLPTRRLLSDRLEHALAHAERHPDLRPALLFIDLDNFKSVNDRYGHDAGDALLVGVAERLRACVREGDTVARFGGDEFVVLLAGLDEPSGVQRLVERVNDQLTLPILGAPLEVTASVGVALAEAGIGARELLVRADTAMYRAKALGKTGRVVVGAE